MASKGGKRPGAGRPKNPPPTPVRFDFTHKETPLEYMLAVMNDNNADAARRDKMAVAAAPYCHPRFADNKITKKQVRDAEAKTVAIDPEWGTDLHAPDLHAN